MFQDSLIVLLAVAGLVSAVLTAQTQASLLLSIVAGFLAGQFAALARLVHGSFRNPLRRAYLERFIANPYRYVAEDCDGNSPHAVAGELVGFVPLGVVSAPEADPSPAFDVFATADRMVLASVSRASGAVELLSEMQDGRILHSQHMFMPPHRWLIVNRVQSNAPAMIYSSHSRVQGVMAQHGVATVAASLATVVDALSAEHDAYTELGPFLGPYLSVGSPGRNPLPLLVRPTASDVFDLAMTQPSAPAAGATPAGPVESFAATETPAGLEADVPQTDVAELLGDLDNQAEHLMHTVSVVREPGLVPRLCRPTSAAAETASQPPLAADEATSPLPRPADVSPLEGLEVPDYIPEFLPDIGDAVQAWESTGLSAS